MGYSTDFEGSISIEPPLNPIEVGTVNNFCGERHEDRRFPGIWCDWEVSEDGTEIMWNESEKAYSMPEWLDYLIQTFMEGHVLNGTMKAQGEDPSDMWLLHVNNNKVTTQDLVAMPDGAEHVVSGFPQPHEVLILQDESSGMLTVNPQGLAEYIAGFVKDLGGDAPEEAVRIFRLVFPDLPITVNDNGTFTIDTDA